VSESPEPVSRHGRDLVTPDWANSRAKGRCSGSAPSCGCGTSGAAAAAAAQDDRQLHVSRQLATSRQAKPHVARRLLVDPHADGERSTCCF